MGNVITNRNASRLEFERLLVGFMVALRCAVFLTQTDGHFVDCAMQDTAKLYMRHHKVPRSMQRRVQRWYDYSWSR